MVVMQQDLVSEIISKLLLPAESETDILELWRRLAEETKPTLKAAGRLLAVAGTFLCGSCCTARGTGKILFTDGSAVRATGRLLPPGHDEADDADHDAVASLRRQREVERAVRTAAPWASDVARAQVSKCVDHWLTVLAPEFEESVPVAEASTLEEKVGSAFFQLLPSAASSLRELAGGSCANGQRRAMILVMSLHWLMERTHYRALRSRLGLCLPTLLQVLDSSVDSAVRLLGLDALHLMLDRAMAVEVENFLPPLQHCFMVTSPLFLEGDDLAVTTVVPYCAGLILLISKITTKSFAQQRKELLEKFMAFGAVHCASTKAAFRLFLDFGLIPFLQRDALLLAPRLKSVMELLLQATESTDAVEVLLAWRALRHLLEGELKPRAKYYALDLVMRAALGYLTFIASGPPPALSDSGGDYSKQFLSPLVQSMTEAEWLTAERVRPKVRKELEAGLRLLSGGDICLAEILESLQQTSLAGGPLRDQLEAFADFATVAVAVK